MSKNILIADDNPHFLRTLGRVLGMQPGLNVCGLAVDGVDAIEKARHARPDLVVLDLSMPALNGIEATQALKQTMPDVPVIIFTVHKTRFVNAQAAAAGASAIISKSENLNELVGTIRALLEPATESTLHPE
jgi:two-component system, NarL family, nitrate/nitrite response regulator NarL